MKGILVEKFGGPDVLAYRDLDDPLPKANQVRIRVHGAGVNFADVKARADAVVNYQSENYVEKVLSLTDNRGADVILNPLAGRMLERDLDCLASFGRLLCFGNASGAPASFLSDRLQGSCRAVIGFSFGTLRHTRPQEVSGIMQAVIALLAGGKIRMITGRKFPLAKAAEAHRYIESRRSTGKILLQV